MGVHAPTKSRPVRQAKAEGEKVARSRPFEWLARAGFVARGVIYILIGVLAIKLALGHGGPQASAGGHDSTENLRQAMKHYRALFDELVEPDADEPTSAERASTDGAERGISVRR